VHIRTFYRQRRGTRSFAAAVEATGINKGVLSRIERGEQLPKAGGQVIQLVAFYDREAYWQGGTWLEMLRNLYPASVLRCIQLERKCACGCGVFLPPESIRSRLYLEGHRRHRSATPSSPEAER
jgi:hypothetical protein